MPSIVNAGYVIGHGYGLVTERIRNVEGVTSESHIFAAVAEVHEGGDEDGVRRFGDAVFTIHEIVPQPRQDGERGPSVEVRLTVDWDRDLAFRIDVIVVDDE